MLIGCARVSTDDQTLDPRRDAFEQLRAGDTLVVWRLDRLGRSLKDLIERAETLRNRGVGMHSPMEAIAADSSTGQLVFHIFGALAELERALIRERTGDGLRRRGLGTARVVAASGSDPRNGDMRWICTGRGSTR